MASSDDSFHQKDDDNNSSEASIGNNKFRDPLISGLDASDGEVN